MENVGGEHQIPVLVDHRHGKNLLGGDTIVDYLADRYAGACRE